MDFEIEDEGFDEPGELVKIGIDREEVRDNAIFVMYSNEEILNVVSEPGCKYVGMRDSQALLFDLIATLDKYTPEILEHFKIKVIKTKR